jgi:Flp pilus assembly pilin Flp
MLLIPPFTPRPHRAERGRRERGQTTAEYALMLLAVATIAMLVVAWAGSTGRVGALLDAVFRSVTSMVR